MKILSTVSRVQMAGKKILTISLFFALTAVTLHSQMARWQVSPGYSSIERVSPELLRFCQDGRYGIMSIDGKILVDAVNTNISRFSQGYCIATSNGKVNYIIEASGKVAKPQSDCSVDMDFPYFTGGYLCVRNINGVAGYMSADGIVVTGFKYKNALPFSLGFAVVRDADGYYFPLDSRFRIPDQFMNVDYGFMSTFSDINGRICTVVMMGKDLWLIDSNSNKVDFYGRYVSKDGNIIRAQSAELEFDDAWRLVKVRKYGRESVCPQQSVADEINGYGSHTISYGRDVNGLYNLKYRGVDVLAPQFFDIKPITDNCAIASTSTGYGLLAIDEHSNLSFSVNSKLDVVVEHAVDIPVALTLNSDVGAATVTCSSSSVRCSTGKISECNVSGNRIILKFRPDFSFGKTCSSSIYFTPEAGGLIYPEKSVNVNCSYSPAFAVSCPSSVVLNKDNTSKDFSIKILNKSSDVTGLCTIYIDHKVVKTGIRIGGNSSISIPIHRNVNLGDSDSVSLSFTIDVEEESCPSFRATCRSEFRRHFENN